MSSGLPDVPVIKALTASVDAAPYNHVRLLLARNGAPQELRLGPRGLTITLGRCVWLVTQRQLNDLPLMAWTHFDTAHRPGLHAPIRCSVLLYHAYAHLVCRGTLAEVDRKLAGLLRKPRTVGAAPQLIPFHPRGQS